MTFKISIKGTYNMHPIMSNDTWKKLYPFRGGESKWTGPKLGNMTLERLAIPLVWSMVRHSTAMLSVLFGAAWQVYPPRRGDRFVIILLGEKYNQDSRLLWKYAPCYDRDLANPPQIASVKNFIFYFPFGGRPAFCSTVARVWCLVRRSLSIFPLEGFNLS